jgi:hypothetical protein
VHEVSPLYPDYLLMSDSGLVVVFELYRNMSIEEC